MTFDEKRRSTELAELAACRRPRPSPQPSPGVSGEGVDIDRYLRSQRFSSGRWNISCRMNALRSWTGLASNNPRPAAAVEAGDNVAELAEEMFALSLLVARWPT